MIYEIWYDTERWFGKSSDRQKDIWDTHTKISHVACILKIQLRATAQIQSQQHTKKKYFFHFIKGENKERSTSTKKQSKICWQKNKVAGKSGMQTLHSDTHFCITCLPICFSFWSAAYCHSVTIFSVSVESLPNSPSLLILFYHHSLRSKITSRK